MDHQNRTFTYIAILFVASTLVSSVSLVVCQCPSYPSFGTYVPNRNVTEVDKDLIEFALNLEYLEAEFFLWSALGFGLDEVAPQIVQGAPRPSGGQIATLDDFTRNISLQFGLQEVGHLRAILATVEGFPRPPLNISGSVFEQFMNEAFGRRLEPPFNPYQDNLRFMIASYALPYIGLTGYVGMSPMLESYEAKRLVAGLLGMEAEQDAVIRMYLYRMKDVPVEGYPYIVSDFTTKISELRNRLGMTTGLVDEGVEVPTWTCLGAEGRLSQNLLSADAFSLSYARTALPILRILYGTAAEALPGAFFPQGARGIIAEAALHTLGS